LRAIDCESLAGTGFEARVGLVDHIDTAATFHDLAITVTIFQRLERAADFHGKAFVLTRIE
tara:strand:- start:1342 stop:1524 length:183 start_codon:yes stop_codon:yes gene_type:complete